MTAWRRAIELSIEDADLAKLTSITRSRTEPASRVERARMLLAYREDPSFFAVGQALGAHHQTVQRCVERALVYGPIAALDDRQRPGKEPTITGRGQGVVGVAGLPKGQGAGLSARVVDDAASGRPRTRARSGGGARLPRQAGARHGVQDPRRAGGQAAQGALLPGTS
jgi:hypothetical protein